MPTAPMFLYQAKELLLLFKDGAITENWCQRETRIIRQNFGLKHNAPIPWVYVAEHFGYDVNLMYRLMGFPPEKQPTVVTMDLKKAQPVRAEL